MHYIETLTRDFPVRKNRAQKKAFRAWVLEEAARLGYPAAADEKGLSRNIVIGDPEKAAFTVTAHYDTAPRLPCPNLCTPTNKLFFLFYQIAVSLGMIAVAVLPACLAVLLFKDLMISFIIAYALLILLIVLMLCGPANPHCVNDNTSGVAAVLETMARLPETQRDKVAFILFDNEEVGLLGSAAYASAHKTVKKERLIINLDCVGDGENILFIVRKDVSSLPAYTAFQAAAGVPSDLNVLLLEAEKCIYPSDQANFTQTVAVCACHESRRIGYYFSRIHTPKDTVCEQGNLDYLASVLTAFASGI